MEGLGFREFGFGFSGGFNLKPKHSLFKQLGFKQQGRKSSPPTGSPKHQERISQDKLSDPISRTLQTSPVTLNSKDQFLVANTKKGPGGLRKPKGPKGQPPNRPEPRCVHGNLTRILAQCPHGFWAQRPRNLERCPRNSAQSWGFAYCPRNFARCPRCLEQPKHNADELLPQCSRT